ncbi:MAG: cytochrome C [Polyangiaceae bacterium]|nr:cytochrome C [Polyangiaceae bacterium]
MTSIAADSRNPATFEPTHRRLTVLKTQPGGRHGAARWGVIGLALGAIALQVASFFQPWWWIKLYAPQYPKGLKMVISLTGVTGDVAEVDILNHYIGMAKMNDAAPLERQLAGYGIAFVGVAVLAVALLAGKRLNRLLALVGFVFPAAFLTDSFYWMYRFGHTLNPEAPIRLPPFTPQLFGNGKIGQFMTFAQPSAGFWLAVAAFVLLAAAAFARSRVCAGCARRGTCGAVCADAFVGPSAGAAS